jgi:hypothetical protein
MSENAACPRNQPETEQHQSGRFRNLRERHRAEVQPFGIAHVVAELERTSMIQLSGSSIPAEPCRQL